MSKVDARQVFIDKVRFELGAVREITRKQADEIALKYDIPRPHWLFNDPAVRVGRGLYAIKAHNVGPIVKNVKQKVAKAEIGRAHV